MKQLLQADLVIAPDLVHGELMTGDPGGRVELLDKYASYERAAGIPHSQVVAFVRSRRLHGRGIGWIDAHLLCSALVGSHRLWTADMYLKDVADEFGVGYKLPI